MFSLNNLTPLLALSLHRDQYFPMNTEKLNLCMQIEEGDFLCPGIQAIYNKGFGLQSCEDSLLSNESYPAYKFTELKTDAMWLQIRHENHWVFAVKTSVRMTAVCGTETLHVVIEGSGILLVLPNCTLKHNLLTIQGHQITTSTIWTSCSGFIILLAVNKPSRLQPLLEGIDMTPNLRNSHHYKSSLRTTQQTQKYQPTLFRNWLFHIDINSSHHRLNRMAINKEAVHSQYICSHPTTTTQATES